MKVGSRFATLPGLFLLITIPTLGQTTPALAARSEGGCPLTGRNVAGAPYSAVQETIRSQTLADGTHIERQQQRMQVFRDSEGRTREEFYQVLGPAGAQEEFLSNIMIMDPVDCVVYNLEVANHVARVRKLSQSAETQAARSVEQTKIVTGQVQHHTIPEELRPKTSTEQIGTDSIEGLAVEGKRVSTTFPVGSQGNDRPIVTTREVWTSPELKVTVLEKTSDPRSGDTTRRLTNISRAEPSADLFRVPADYKIEDEHQ
jgi:hypothetical protein